MELFIVDACVLIDFVETDRSLLRLISQHVGQIRVPSPVLGEVRQLTRDSAEEVGLVVVEPALDVALQAAERGTPGLSFQDELCLRVAAAEGWTCVTNDRRLRVECEARSVYVRWGLELLLLLVEARVLGTNEAIDAVRAMASLNPRLARKVVLSFERKVRRLG